MKMNPPKKVTVIIAAVLAVAGLVCFFAKSLTLAFVLPFVAAVLMIISVFAKGL